MQDKLKSKFAVQVKSLRRQKVTCSGIVKNYRKEAANLRICGSGLPIAILRNLRLRNRV